MDEQHARSRACAPYTIDTTCARVVFSRTCTPLPSFALTPPKCITPRWTSAAATAAPWPTCPPPPPLPRQRRGAGWPRPVGPVAGLCCAAFGIKQDRPFQPPPLRKYLQAVSYEDFRSQRESVAFYHGMSVAAGIQKKDWSPKQQRSARPLALTAGSRGRKPGPPSEGQ